MVQMLVEGRLQADAQLFRGTVRCVACAGEAGDFLEANLMHWLCDGSMYCYGW